MKAEVRIINGNPELLVDGRLIGRTLGRLAEPGYNAPEKLAQYREAGLEIFFTSLHESNDWCWDGEDGFDYDTYEAHLAALVEAKPDIKLILYVGGRVGAPYLWCKNHPEELLTREDGSKPRAGSFASDIWLRDSTDAVRRFVQHFEASEFAGNIVGYNPIYINNEWMAWLDHGSYADFSAPMQRRFRQWLRDWYACDEAALRQSWKDPGVTFENALVPSGEERLNWGREGFFDYVERRGNKVGDYYRCYNESTADLAISFCRAIKEASGHNKLCGLMHMYMYTYFEWPPNVSYSGHCAAKKLLESPHIDFFHSPYDYHNRCFGAGHYSQHAIDSITARGKVHLDQIDTKTYRHPSPNTNAKTPWETWQVLKRDVANSLTRNSYHYYYEMSVGCFRGFDRPTNWRELTYDGKDMSEWIARLTRLARDNQTALPEQAADVAIVSSAEYGYYRAHRKGFGDMFHGGLRQHILAYAGTPFADYVLEDFAAIQRRHKLYIFPNAQYVPSRLRETIHRKLAADGATALWFYAPGYVDETGPSLDNIAATSGFRLRKDDGFNDFLQVDLTDFDHPITRGLAGARSPGSALPPDAGCSYGSDLDPEYFRACQEWAQWIYDRDKHYKYSPAFVVDDPAATPLGNLRGTGMPGFAVKDMGGWRSVFTCAPFPPLKLMSNLIRFAGGHLYSETNDLIYANSRYVAFQCNGSGPRQLLLPASAKISDALTGEVLKESSREHRFEGTHGEVTIFRTDNATVY